MVTDPFAAHGKLLFKDRSSTIITAGRNSLLM